MIKGLVSVVVPIYNVEQYLERCINSIVSQTYSDLEILLIDDGSPDNCPQMCDEWANRDSRIKVVHKKNAGLGMARNTGIDHSTGEYICFVDSDDYIDCDTVQSAISVLLKNNTECVVYGYKRVNASGECISDYIPNTEQTIYRGHQIVDAFLPDLIAYNPKTGVHSQLQMSSCMMLIATNVIHRANWRFVSERCIISEDYYSLLDLYKNIHSVSVIKKSFYYYCENTYSLTQKFDENRIGRIIDWYQKSIDLCEKHQYSEVVVERLGIQFLSNMIAALKQLSRAPISMTFKLSKFDEVLHNLHVSKALKCLDITNEKFSRKLLFDGMKKKRTIVVFAMCRLKR